ncbi:MAG: GNAT family N-acetyltransferase [Ignavibacteriae bacterium]|nr:MAG: GNAT family N-acetyltransferase [Ignavibacteriota bacterium]
MNVSIRRFAETDSITELTGLLHRAYKKLADMGLYFVATHISEDDAKRLIDGGECFVAEHDGKIIGTILLYAKGKHNPEYYLRDDVIVFGKFAVEPEYQNKGIGEMMMNYIEDYVKSKGIKELALDTAEQAQHLIDYYSKRGYKFVGYHKWSVVNYRSVIMSKQVL